jgi:hypothetical protein
MAVARTAAGSRATATRTVTGTALAFRSFRGNDQLQQSFRIIEKLVGSSRVQSQRASRQLRGNRGLRHSRVGRHKTNFVDVNVRITLQRCFQLLSKL